MEGEPQVFPQVHAPGAPAHACLLLAVIGISDGIGEAGLRVGVDAEACVSLQCRVEVHVHPAVPVAVHVFGLGHPSARLLVIFRAAGGAVLCGAELCRGRERPLQRRDALVIVGLHLLGERGLQVRVSQADVQRIGIAERVGDEVGDVGLSGVSAVLQAQLLLLGEPVAEVEGGRGVHHMAAHVVVLGPFGIVHRIVLRLGAHTRRDAIACAHDAPLQVDVMVGIGVFRGVALVDVGR